MTKKLDPDILVLRACVRALEKSSSITANVNYLYDRYVQNPREPEAIKKFDNQSLNPTKAD